MDRNGETFTQPHESTTSFDSIFTFHNSDGEGYHKLRAAEEPQIGLSASSDCDTKDTIDRLEDDITELVLDATVFTIRDYTMIIDDLVDGKPGAKPDLTNLLVTYHSWKLTQRSADEKSVTLQYLSKISQGLRYFSLLKAANLELASINNDILFLQQTVVDFMLGGHVADIERFNRCVGFEIAPPTAHAMGARNRPPLDASGFPLPQKFDIPPSYEQQQKDLLASCVTGVDPNPKVRLDWAWNALACVRILSRDKNRLHRALNLQSTQESETTSRLRELGLKIIDKDSRNQVRDAVFYKVRIGEIEQLDRREDPSNPSDSEESASDLTHKYLRAAKLGCGRAHYHLGMSYDRSDTSLASMSYAKGVRLGDSGCMNRRAMISLSSDQRQQEAVDLLRRSAENADRDAPEGALNYGLFLADELFEQYDPGTYMPNLLFAFQPKEKGHQRDPELARQFIAKAAMLGSGKAQLRLGRAYELSQLGYPLDPVLSLHYYRLAATQGCTEAALGVSKWFMAVNISTFGRNNRLTFEYLLRAATGPKGLAEAQFALGNHYESGGYGFVERNTTRAQEWYMIAASNGNGAASAKLAEFGRNVAIGIDFGSAFSSVSWADVSRPGEIHHVRNWYRTETASDVHGTLTARSAKQDESSVMLGYLDMRGKIIRLKRKGVLGAHATIPEDFVGNPRTGEHIQKSLSRIWRHALDEIRAAADPPGFFSVQKVTLSVPAHWKKPGRDSLKKIAKSVGICDTKGPGMEILDDTALAMFSLSIDEFQSSSFKDGDAFIVFDCGSNAVRSTSYQIGMNRLGEFRQITVENKGLEGGASIDRNFERYVLRYGYLSSMSSQAASEELSHMRDNDWMRRVKVDFDGSQYKDDIKVYSVLSKPPLPIDREDVRQMFAGTLANIKTVLEEEVTRLHSMGLNPKGMYIVGGLAACRYVRENLEDYIPELPLPSDFQIVQMSQPNEAVSTGAAMASVHGLLKDDKGWYQLGNELQNTK